MPNLSEAYAHCVGVLKPQKQGTCGLYSFWFATLLVNDINTSKKPIVYPRKTEERAATGVTKGNETQQSLREFAKGKWIQSGQGELLSLMEVILMVGEFKWDWLAHIAGGDGRMRFITESLGKNRPVMFAHLAGGWPVRPQTAIPPSRACGPHWGLLIAETTTEYKYIEPNDPNTLATVLKTDLLTSNDIVDTFAMSLTWHKPQRPAGTNPGLGQGHVTVGPPPLGMTSAKNYTVDRRQALKNLLVAIY